MQKMLLTFLIHDRTSVLFGIRKTNRFFSWLTSVFERSLGERGLVTFDEVKTNFVVFHGSSVSCKKLADGIAKSATWKQQKKR